MSKNGKEYKLAIRIAGVVDKSYDLALTSASTKIKGFKGIMGKIDSTFTEMDKGFNKVMKAGKKCFDAITTAAKVAGLAIGTVSVAVGKVGSDFEAEMSTVQAISQATNKDLDRLSKKAREVGKTSVFSATEVGEAMEYMGMAGWKTEEMLAGIEGVVNLAAASGEDIATVSSIVVDTLTAMGKTADSTSEFVDVLAQAAMNSNTNVELMGETFKYAAPVAGALGYDFKDLAIATGLMASSGIKGSLAGTALRNMLTRMAKPTKESRDAMEKLGLSLSDDEGKMYSLMDIMMTLRKNFADGGDSEGMAAALSTLGGLTDDQIEEYKSGLGELSKAEEAFYAAELGGQRGMSGLLALANSTDEQFMKLTDAIYGAEGAVGQMASVRLNNLQGDVTILKDAVKDAGIELYYQFNDNLRSIVQNVTDFVNAAATKIPEFFNKLATAWPTIWRKFKQYGAPIFKVIVDAGSWIIKHGKGIISIIAGIGMALASYKILSTISHVIMSIMKLASIGGLFVDYKLTERELIDQNLADHFGDIALSMEEISEVADHIISTDNLGKVKDALDEFEELDQYKTQMKNAVDELNKLNWKVSIGMELTPEDKDAYSNAIDTFVKNVKDYVIQENYAIDISLSTFLDPTSQNDREFKAKVDSFYNANLTTLENLGEDLASAVSQGFENGFKMDDVRTIAKIQQQMSEIQRQLAVDEFDVALSTIGAQFSGAALDPETFKNLQDELNESVTKATDAYYESYAKTQLALEKMYGAGGISKTEYDEMSNRNRSEMESGIAETSLRALEFQMNTIYDTYGSHIDDYMEVVDRLVNEYAGKFSDYANTFGINPEANESLWNQLLTAIYGDESIDAYSSKAVGERISSMMDQISGLDDIAANLKSALSKATDKQTVEKLAGLLKRIDEFKTKLKPALEASSTEMSFFGVSDFEEYLLEDITGKLISGSDNEGLDAWLNDKFTNVTGRSYIKAQEAAKQAADDTQTLINEAFNRDFTAEADVNVYLRLVAQGTMLSAPGLTMSEIYGSNLPLDTKNALAHKIAGHANGGFVNGLQLSWLGEKGPEAVIPLNGSDRAMSLWEKTGQLLGMKSLTDRYNISGGSSGSDVRIEYNPTLQFYGEAPSRADLDDALRMSQDDFEAMMERYLKNNGRLAFR